MSAEITLTADNFQAEVIESQVPVLVDYWAEWCGPCRMIGPLVEKIAEEYQGKIKVGKLNVDENPDIAAKYGIISIPTLMVFKNGEIVNQQAGAGSKAHIEGLFTPHL